MVSDVEGTKHKVEGLVLIGTVSSYPTSVRVCLGPGTLYG